MSKINHSLVYIGKLILLTILASACIQTLSAQPLSIEDAVQESLQNNLALLVDKYEIDIARAEIITARLRPNPELGIDLENLDSRSGWIGSDGVLGPAEYAMRAEFVIEGPGKRARRIEVASYGLGMVEMAFKNSVRELIFEVRNLALDFLLAKANLELSRENLERLESIEKMNQVRFLADDIPRSELLRIQLEVKQFRNEVSRQELELGKVREQLRLLLGRPAAVVPVEITDNFRSDNLEFDTFTLKEMALERRPDLHAAIQANARSLADVRLQYAERRLDYTLGTEFRREHRTGNAIGVFVSIPLPLFDRNQGEIARARAEQLQAESILLLLQAEIEAEVEEAYAEYMLARNLLRGIETEMLEPARDIIQAAEVAYQRGGASLMELLDAQMVFSETMNALNEARSDYARSLYRLESVTAKGLKP